MSSRPPLLALLLLSGCFGARPAYQQASLKLRAATFTIEAHEVDAQVMEMLEASLVLASEELTIWGGLRLPVTLHVLPDREQLQRAVGKDQAWLSAWARFDTIHLQSPRSWSLLPPRQSDVDRMLLHELTHSLLYQRAAQADTWRNLSLPLWFDEGMASYTAQQAYRWPGLEELARWYEHHPEGEDPLRPNSTLYAEQHHLVYGAAHHAFTFLVERYGRHSVIALMAAMQAGQDFDSAFLDAVGIARDRFEDDFRRYVRLRGFKRGGPLRPAPSAPDPMPVEVPRQSLDTAQVNPASETH